MSGRYLTELPDILDAAGLDVVLVDGWEHRARSSGGYASGRPWVVAWHHTASQTTPDNDVAYIINASTAPISNIYAARTGEMWVIAAGATNTNGSGGPLKVSRGTIPADKLNEYAVSIEGANSGVGEPWPQDQIDAMFAASIAITNALGLEPDDITSHTAWTSRKIDPATAAAVQGPWRPRSINSSGSWNLDDLRAECRRRASSAPTPTPPTPDEEDDMKWTRLTITEAGAVFMGMSDGTVMPQVEWVNGNDPRQLARYQAYGGDAMPTMTISVTDCSGICLLGPVPTGDARWNWTRTNFGNVIP